MDAPPLEYHPSGPAKACMILLHGLGASGADLFPLAETLAGGSMHVVCPDAPVRPVTVNGGMAMRAWYDIAGINLADRQDRAGADASAAAIENLIAEKTAAGFGADRLYLAGFSQGGAMALHVGLRHAQPLAGIICLSGYLLFPEQLEKECRNHSTPIFQAHGSLDAVVLPQWAHMTRDWLTAQNYALEYREYPMLMHGIAPEEIADLNAFLAR